MQNWFRIAPGSQIKCDLLCARTFECVCWFSCFLASAKRVALVFWGRLEKVRPALRKAGRAFSQMGKFPYISQLFLCARAEIWIEMHWFGKGATCFAQSGSHFFGSSIKKVATWQSGSEDQSIWVYYIQNPHLKVEIMIYRPPITPP